MVADNGHDSSPFIYSHTSLFSRTRIKESALRFAMVFGDNTTPMCQCDGCDFVLALVGNDAVA